MEPIMNTIAETLRASTEHETDYVTMYVGDMLLGVDIAIADEINRHVDVTPVPHAPGFVCGVLNLRGEVVTVVDLRMILGFPPTQAHRNSRTVIVRSAGEKIGLRVDRVADVVRARTAQIAPVPPNLAGVDGRLFKGVFRLTSELLVVLDIEVALAGNTHAA
jgi:purine-binding chemotaxis protein CheW